MIESIQDPVVVVYILIGLLLSVMIIQAVFGKKAKIDGEVVPNILTALLGQLSKRKNKGEDDGNR